MKESKKQEIIDLVLSEVNHLEDILNNILLKNFAVNHNINPEYSIFKIKQELIADSALFLNKKIYGLYIISKEHKRVDEFEIRGMIMRKSNFPEFSRLKIETLLDMILKSDTLDLEKISNFVNASRIEAIKLCNEGSYKIAGAVSFTKPLEVYKKIPSHVKAMQLWNNLEYDYFINGTKGFLYRIQGIDVLKAPERVLKNSHLFTSKNVSIVVPFEEDQLPDYYILNLDSQLHYCWDSRVSEIMNVFYNKDTMSMSDLIEDEYLPTNIDNDDSMFDEFDDNEDDEEYEYE